MFKFKRVLIKVSGESLAGASHSGIDADSVRKLATELKQASELGVEIGVVVGGGNFWRGRSDNSMDRGVADYIGMLATVMNGLALGEALKSVGADCTVMSAIAMDKIAEPYQLQKAQSYLSQGKIVVFCGGTGSPYFSTDTAVALRACEMHADAMLCAKNIDGVYDSDPKFNANAKKFEELTFDDVLKMNLKVLDQTAVAMCREYSLPVVVFGMAEPDGVKKVLSGKKIGTLIK